MSSDAGLTLLREIERQTGLAQRLASGMVDPRDPAKGQHSRDDIYHPLQDHDDRRGTGRGQ